jgi:tetratricopeptide (TPR) repeat protein
LELENESFTDDQSSARTGIYCPSCAALVSETANIGDPLKCPVCGTEFSAGARSTTIEETAVTRTEVASRQRKLSTEEILLERFKNEPPEKKPVGWQTMAIIAGTIVVIVFVIVQMTSKPDVYAPGHPVDSSAIVEKRQFFQHIIDSVQSHLALVPSDINAHLSLANAYYDAALWTQSRKEYETYLSAKPKDADARVDYAYAIGQETGNPAKAIAQIDSALAYDPEHLNALLNGGILSAQMISEGNHTAGLAKAREYFQRARAVAKRNKPEMVGRIDTLLEAINSTGNRPAARPAK